MRIDRRVQGLTLVEMLIVLAILGFVLLITSSGIIQALQVNRLVEDGTNTQAKLRRVTEITSQELRSAVLGGLTDFPVASSSQGLSFALLGGDGGMPVTDSPGGSWHNSVVTYVYSTDDSARSSLIGSPALIINGDGRAVFVDEITGAPGHDKVQHNNCTIPIDYTPNTRLYSAAAFGLEFVEAEQTLYQVTWNGSGQHRAPFAFGISAFEVQYEYSGPGGMIPLPEPHRDGAGNPQPIFELGGHEYEIARLRVSIASAADGERSPREYSTYIELAGIGNDLDVARTITEIVPCGAGGGSGNPGGGDDGSDPDDPGGGGGDDDDGGGGDDDDGGGSDPGDEDDDEWCIWLPIVGWLCW